MKSAILDKLSHFFSYMNYVFLYTFPILLAICSSFRGSTLKWSCLDHFSPPAMIDFHLHDVLLLAAKSHSSFFSSSLRGRIIDNFGMVRATVTSSPSEGQVSVSKTHLYTVSFFCNTVLFFVQQGKKMEFVGFSCFS